MTTLGTSMHIASSSLGSTQVQLSVTANNIANADTPGYTTKSANQSATISAGVGSGVEVTKIEGKVDQFLLTDLLSSTSKVSAAVTTQSYLDELQTNLGSLTSETGDGSALSNTISDFETSLSALSASPESSDLAYASVAALEDVTNQINGAASDISSQIEKADDQIKDSVETVNETLAQIDTLNEQIRIANAAGNSTAELQDQMNNALVSLSEQMDIQTINSADGTTKVFTSSGQMLVGEQAHFVTTGTDASGHTTLSVNGQEITDQIGGGNIGALIDLRDTILPGYLAAYDEMAATLITEFNAVQPGLLSGSSASDIAISDALSDDPSLLLGTGNPAEAANALLNVLQGDTHFDEAGNMPESDKSFAAYAGDILSAAARDANNATSQLETASYELSIVENSIASKYGVNVDEETARLAELEQLYSLSSTILNIVQQMFDDLRSAVS